MAEEEVKEVSRDEFIEQFMAETIAKVNGLEADLRGVIGLLKELADKEGYDLKRHQMDGGKVLMRWESRGRIVSL